MKVVLNRCWGGFHLSDKALERLIELGIPVLKEGYEKAGIEPPQEPYIYESKEDRFGKYYWSSSNNEDRSHPLLVQVVEELGEDSYDHSVSELKVVNIPDGISWHIHDYDGMESVEEDHDSWS